MPGWFDTNIEDSFQLFSTEHIVMLVILFSGIALLLAGQKTLHHRPRVRQFTRWTLFVLLLFSEAGHQVWGLANQNWNMEEHAPLHLCGIASLLAMVALIYSNQKLIQTLYFIAILPAIITLFTPEVFYSFPHFRFMKFFLHHMALAWAGVFLVMATSTRITFKSMLQVFAKLNGYAVFIFILNRMIGTNYLFLAGTPDVSTPLDVLGDGVWYYINLELFCFGIFLLMYLLYRGGDLFSVLNRRTEDGHHMEKDEAQ
ncbi:TIGR02206 family membrane protein [Halobacillus locisalis]|uniref:TIGR02206 family membrane protein n=1 Tax=Halobacillus locisalis TaxID=220753 RepID=A0A838CUY1_9BACI|nr:TIGR02206 family membrane protein [Halobacillus locisalis]MBA2175877.1 TIGR02206 family membrane protein [Halobacillus locisalis]